MVRGEYKLTAEELAALEILKSTRVGVMEAALVAKEALAAGRGRVKRARRCVELGTEALQCLEKTVTFERAVEAALAARRERRARTQTDFRYFTRRFIKRCKGLSQRRVRSISATECAGYIAEAFSTERQRSKARMVLSGVFSTAVKRGWCSENPVRKVEEPRVREGRLPILSETEIRHLLKTAQEYRGGICLPAVGMMLYAGIRPNEVARLTWAEVDLRHGFISILPRHSKTGGARRVTIHPVLAHMLRQHRQEQQQRICPPARQRHWRQLHLLQKTPWRPGCPATHLCELPSGAFPQL